MEGTIYTGIQERLEQQASYLVNQNHPAVAHVDWWKNQVDDALAQDAEENTGLPWPCPAVFVEFGQTQVTGGFGGSKSASGELTLHVVQDVQSVNSEQGSGTQAEFKHLLTYVEALLDVLDGHKATCGARLNHTGTTRDHTNRPLMHEQLRFNWSAVLKRQAV